MNLGKKPTYRAASVACASALGFAGGMSLQLEQLAAELPEVYENVVPMAAGTSKLPQYRDSTDAHPGKEEKC